MWTAGLAGETVLARLDGRVDVRECDVEGGVVGGYVGDAGCEPERGLYAAGAIWRRRKGSLGSVKEILRVRLASIGSWPGGGRSDERRIGGSSI
jgi:hypothetical protein